METRPQWPHTIDDILKSLDGIWGLVGATATNGNLLRLERSLQAPTEYTLTEYEGTDEAKVVSEKKYPADQKGFVVGEFASRLGFGA